MTDHKLTQLRCDSSPLTSFAEMFECALKVCERGLGFGDFPLELARVDLDASPASAGELTVRLYPSDAFLRFAATLFAGNLKFGIVKES
jgi:hypothetical protein